MIARMRVLNIKSLPRSVWPRGVLTVSAILAVLLLMACAGGPLESQVAATVTSGKAPLSVTYTNSSKNADEFRWDFGDGSTATTRNSEEQVTHEYTEAGTHTLTLAAIKAGDPPQTRSANITITVEPGLLERITLDPPELTMEVAQTQQFTVAAFDRFDNTIQGLSYTFRSDEKAGKIDSDGKFIAGNGSGIYENGVTVEVAHGGVSRTLAAKVILEPGLLHRVAIDPTAAAVTATEELEFSANAFDRYDNPIPGLIYAYRSDERAGRVDSDGRFVAGTTSGTYGLGVVVEVSNPGKVFRTATAEVTVASGPLDHVTIEPPAHALEVTQRHQFVAAAYDRFDNLIHGLTYIFRSDEEAGKVSVEGSFSAGTRAGSYERVVTVEVSEGAATQKAAAKLTIVPASLDRVILEPAAPTVEVTKAQQFTALAYDRFDNSIPGLTYVYRADDGAGQIDAGGIFSAGTVAGTYDGAVTVEVSQDESTAVASVNVTVAPGPLDSVSLDPAATSLEVTAVQQFTAAAFDEFDNPIPGLTYVYSAEGGAGQIGSGGNLSAGTVAGTYEGAVTVEVAQDGSTAVASATVTVAPGPLDHVIIDPAGRRWKSPFLSGLRPQHFDRFDNPIPGLTYVYDADEKAGQVDAGGIFSAGTVAAAYDGAVTVQVSQGSLLRERLGPHRPESWPFTRRPAELRGNNSGHR